MLAARPHHRTDFKSETRSKKLQERGWVAKRLGDSNKSKPKQHGLNEIF